SKATIRRRRLPEDQVLWLVLGMALFRNEPIEEVARRLNICSEGLASESLLAKSGISSARQRLGAEPLQWLFQRTGQHWASERFEQDDWLGLQVFAVDGAQFRTPDNPELREHFGSGNTSTNRQTPYPLLRCVALMNTHTHVVMDAQVSPFRRGEVPLAEAMLAKIPDHSVTLFDKAFWSANLMHSLSSQETHRHWLIPKKTGVVYEVVEQYGAGDQLWRMKVSPQARKKNPGLPEYWYARAVTYGVEGTEKTVVTSLPAEVYPKESVAQLYHQRWEIELSFRDMKTSMLNNAMTLRSKKVDLVYQEVWGLLLAYNLVRREASHAAAVHGQRVKDIRFKAAFHYIAANLVVMAEAKPESKTGMRLRELRSGISSLFLVRKPRPGRPRIVKMSKTRYPVNRNAAPLK
ncbi:MAG: IS4 family transposase, partial [Endozoicomonas sp.]|uniref:IS4 family transposase n=1 Tax=Endozoicomonas sp. TaxID=1892382 RepID=UPI003D9B9038